MEKIKDFNNFSINEKETPEIQGKILVILGAPGSGKGTLSKELKNKYGFQHISTGDLIRNSNDEEIKKIIADGNFIPDEKMIKMLRKELKKWIHRQILYWMDFLEIFHKPKSLIQF